MHAPSCCIVHIYCVDVLRVYSPIDLLVCIGALYSSRHFERIFGTAKTCALGTLVTSTSALVSLAIAGLETPESKWLRLVQGPYALLGAALLLFTKLIPQRIAQFTVLGVRFSDKSFSYLMFAHVICAHGAGSIIPALLGVVMGAAYLYNAGGLGNLRVPSVVRDLASKTVLPILLSEHPVARAARKAAERAGRERRQMEAVVRETMRRRGGLPAAGGGGATEEEQVQAALAQLLAQRNGHAPQHAAPGTGGSGDAPQEEGGSDAFVPPLAEADEEAVQRLVGMGFAEEAARQALAATYNEENAAVNRLVGGT